MFKPIVFFSVLSERIHSKLLFRRSIVASALLPSASKSMLNRTEVLHERSASWRSSDVVASACIGGVAVRAAGCVDFAIRRGRVKKPNSGIQFSSKMLTVGCASPWVYISRLISSGEGGSSDAAHEGGCGKGNQSLLSLRFFDSHSDSRRGLPLGRICATKDGASTSPWNPTKLNYLGRAAKLVSLIHAVGQS